MLLLGRISIASGHSVVPFMCACFYRTFAFCLAFLLPFVWFATARNDIDPAHASFSRTQVLKWLERQDVTVAGMHVPYPAMGHLTMTKRGLELELLK